MEGWSWGEMETRGAKIVTSVARQSGLKQEDQEIWAISSYIRACQSKSRQACGGTETGSIKTEIDS